jgi:hypothetical protein
VLKRNELVRGTGFLASFTSIAGRHLLSGCGSDATWTLLEVTSTIILEASDIVFWFATILRVIIDSVPPATTLELGTTLSIWFSHMGGLGGVVSIVTETFTVILKRNELVGLTFGLASLVIISITPRTPLQVTVTVVEETTQIVLGRSCENRVLVDSIPPASALEVFATLFVADFFVRCSRGRVGVVTETLTIVLKGDVLIVWTLLLTFANTIGTVVTISLWSTLHVAVSIVDEATFVTLRWRSRVVLAVAVNRVPPTRPCHLVTTFSVGLLWVCGSRCAVGVVTATPAIVLKSDKLVVAASELTFSRIIAVPFRTIPEVAIPIVGVATQIVRHHLVLGVLENCVPPATSLQFLIDLTLAYIDFRVWRFGLQKATLGGA